MVMDGWIFFPLWLLALAVVSSQCAADTENSVYAGADSTIRSSANQKTRLLASASVSVTIDNPFLASPAPTSTPAETPTPTSATTKPAKVSQAPPPTIQVTENGNIETTPSPVSTPFATTVGPSAAPFDRAVELLATDGPSNDTWTNTPPPTTAENATAVATNGPTVAPTINSTLAHSLTESMASPNAMNLTSVPINTTATAELIAKVRAIRDEASFSTSLSLWSSQSNTTNLKVRILRALESMFCQSSLGGSELGSQGRVCVFDDEDSADSSDGNSKSQPSSSSSSSSNMLEDGSVVESVLEAPTEDDLGLGSLDPDATILRFSMERPTEKTVDGLSWSEWEISWVVVRLGSSLAEQFVLKIQQQLQEAGTGSSDTKLNITDVYNEAVANLKEDVVVKMNTSIMDGNLDHLINTATYEGSLAVSSMVGEEEETFGPFATPGSTASQDSVRAEYGGKNDDDTDTILYVGLFFAGLGVGFVAILVFLCFACKPRIDKFFASVGASNHKSTDELVDVTDGQSSQEESRGTRDTLSESNHKVFVIDSMEAITSNRGIDEEYVEDMENQFDDTASSSPNSVSGTHSVAQSVAYSGVWSVAPME